MARIRKMRITAEVDGRFMGVSGFCPDGTFELGKENAPAAGLKGGYRGVSAGWRVA